MKEALEKYDAWDDTYLNIFVTIYEINGSFDRIPYLKSFQANAVIITDEHGGEYCSELMILPANGKESEVKAEINRLLGEIIPERIDIAPTNLHVMIANEQNMFDVLKFVVYVLAVISMVTTVATIYSSVSLDTRRRRKEMALRKINGANTSDIIPKPWDNDKLLGIVESAVELSHSRKAPTTQPPFPDGCAVGDAVTPLIGESPAMQAIDRSNGNLTTAAHLLGITRYALYRKIEKYGL